MGPVSGFLLRSPHEPSIYIVGDSILCNEVEQVLTDYQPNITICFAGSAQFSSGDPITMTKKDVCLLGKKAPFTKIIVVHMEAWNHCTLSRQELKKHIYSQNQSAQIYVPNDGEIIPISFQSR